MGATPSDSAPRPAPTRTPAARIRIAVMASQTPRRHVWHNAQGELLLFPLDGAASSRPGPLNSGNKVGVATEMRMSRQHERTNPLSTSAGVMARIRVGLLVQRCLAQPSALPPTSLGESGLTAWTGRATAVDIRGGRNSSSVWSRGGSSSMSSRCMSSAMSRSATSKCTAPASGRLKGKAVVRVTLTVVHISLKILGIMPIGEGPPCAMSVGIGQMTDHRRRGSPRKTGFPRACRPLSRGRRRTPTPTAPAKTLATRSPGLPRRVSQLLPVATRL